MAEYNFEDKTSAEIVGSYNSYKGKNTTATRKLELLLDLLLDQKATLQWQLPASMNKSQKPNVLLTY